MIDKTEAQNMGLKTKEAGTSIADGKADKLAQIKAIMPELVNGDDMLDVSALKDLLGAEKVATPEQGYTLNFAGKGLAKGLVDIPATKELKIEEKSKNFDATKNVIIRGDNLEALKILRESYGGKIKMIYIDPPYNTGNDNFVYKDNFKNTTEELIKQYGISEEEIDFFNNLFGTKAHSSWLYFMYSRLKLARDLLTDDGVIFISIDDNEQASLKLMCDEIFGEENFIANIVWTNKEGGGGSDSKLYKVKHEYIFCYAKIKNEALITGNEVEEDDSYNKQDEHVEERGRYKLIKLSSGSIRRSESLDYGIKCPDGKKIFPRDNSTNNLAVWRWSKKKFEWGLRSGFIEFRKDKSGEWIVYTKQYHKVDNENKPITRTLPPSALIDRYSSTTATKSQEGIFNKSKVFQYPKPHQLIKELLKVVPMEKDIVLDFFAGSGTTAHAVMELNKEDGGDRKFILVQWDEVIEEDTPAYAFCKENELEPVISSICIERVNRAGEKIKQEAGLEGNKLDIGYKVFSLTDKPKLVADDNQQLELLTKRATTNDTLYNMIIASGEALLSDTIKEIEPDALYKINNAYFVLGECKTDLKDAGRIFVNGYADISLEKALNMLGLKDDNKTILY